MVLRREPGERWLASCPWYSFPTFCKGREPLEIGGMGLLWDASPNEQHQNTEETQSIDHNQEYHPLHWRWTFFTTAGLLMEGAFLPPFMPAHWNSFYRLLLLAMGFWLLIYLLALFIAVIITGPPTHDAGGHTSNDRWRLLSSSVMITYAT